ncbi:MAG: Mrp/NBP35 family ATP-binding protein [Rikenellaceae bacterium]
MITTEQVISVLSAVQHPELKSDIVTLEMVQDVLINEDRLKFTIQLKRTNDPFSSSIKRQATEIIINKLGVAKENITIFIKEPAPKSKKPNLKGINGVGEKTQNIIAISSAKGGVGKSTVTASLAVSLARRGYKVGVLDADIYGPSMPMMFGIEGYVPEAVVEDGKELIIPAEKYGVKVMSIGFFISDSDALVWRGPMATNALRQLIHQTKWDQLDFILIDMPPGTGDIHLTLISELKMTGAIIVSTPQNVALADVVRGVNMFKSENVNVPILGLIENMAWFTPMELPDNKYFIFGEGGCRKLAEKEGLELLAEIPLVQGVREGGDTGAPYALENEILKDTYDKLIDTLVNF